MFFPHPLEKANFSFFNRIELLQHFCLETKNCKTRFEKMVLTAKSFSILHFAFQHKNMAKKEMISQFLNFTHNWKYSVSKFGIQFSRIRFAKFDSRNLFGYHRFEEIGSKALQSDFSVLNAFVEKSLWQRISASRGWNCKTRFKKMLVTDKRFS